MACNHKARYWVMRGEGGFCALCRIDEIRQEMGSLQRHFCDANVLQGKAVVKLRGELSNANDRIAALVTSRDDWREATKHATKRIEYLSARLAEVDELLGDAEAFVSLITYRKSSALPTTQFETREDAEKWLLKARRWLYE